MTARNAAHNAAHNAAQSVRHRLLTLTGAAHALLSGRGASALTAALLALDRPGGIVVLPANTCYIVLWAVRRAGMIPHLADVDPHTAALDPAALPTTLQPAAIVPALMYGLPAPLDALAAWADAHTAALIVDAALTIPQPLPGLAAIYSFGTAKPLDHGGGSGGGGALVSADPAFGRAAERAQAAFPRWTPAHAQHARAWDDLYWALHQHADADPRLNALYPPLYDQYRELIAYRLPADHWHGLTGRLLHADREADRRRALAAIYQAVLTGLPVTVLPNPADAPLWRFPVYVDPTRRDDLLDRLWADGWHTVTRWYPSLHGMAAALWPDVPQPATPIADRLAARVITLPLDPALTPADAARLGAALAAALAADPRPS